MTSITNDGSDIIHKKINAKFISDDLTALDHFEIESTADWIRTNNFKKVGLQFPDELLPISFPISLRLKVLVDCQLGIMADSSYSSCCIDEVDGEKFSVEAIVHYGHSCLTPTHRKLPVKYVFGNCSFDDSNIEENAGMIATYLSSQFPDGFNKCVTILSDFKYSAYSRAISDKLVTYKYVVYNSFPNLPDNEPGKDLYVSGSRLIERCNESDNGNVILFIGDRYDYSVKTSLLSLLHRHANMVMFSPASREIRNISSEMHRFLKSRLYSIEVAKDAKRVGLLVGTLSLENYLEIYHYLYWAMRQSGKIVYPMVVGKINPNKLANFADLDVLVVINCAESCLQFSDKNDEYFKPVVTPYEMICACDPVRFSNPIASPYLTDFRDLLRPEHRIITLSPGNDRSEVSMISGKIVHCSTDDASTDANGVCNSLISRLDSDWSICAIDKSTRSWYGLDPQLGQTEVAKIKEGRSGIAAGYDNEKQ